MHFSYSSARDAYTEYDPEISPNKSITHNWQSYVADCDIQRQSMVKFIYSRGERTRRQHIAFLRVDRDASGEISWKFESKQGVQINNLLLYVNSDDDVKWQLKIWTPYNQLDPIQLSPKEEKFDNLSQAVTRMELTAKLPSSEATIFKEYLAKNQISMLVAVNKATEVYLNDKGHLKDDKPPPSVQNNKKALALVPDENDVFAYDLDVMRQQAKISKTTYSWLSIHGTLSMTNVAYVPYLPFLNLGSNKGLFGQSSIEIVTFRVSLWLRS